MTTPRYSSREGFIVDIRGKTTRGIWKQRKKDQEGAKRHQGKRSQNKEKVVAGGGKLLGPGKLKVGG